MPPAISKNDSSPAIMANDTSAGTFGYFYSCEKAKNSQPMLQGCGSVLIFYGSGSGILGWPPIRTQIRIGKKLQLKTFFIFFFIKNCNLPIPRPPIKYVQVIEEAFSSQKRPSNTSKPELLQIFFLLLRVIFALLDPDPGSGSGSGSTDPIESGSNPDPDPQPCNAMLNSCVNFLSMKSFKAFFLLK